uniref:Uncharacterized protein n=1 Tax=viral metagenome TaxID=1070528 RepID=A0A6H1ZPH2_9ZZZZ
MDANDRAKLTEIISYYDNYPYLEKLLKDHDENDAHFIMYALVLELIKSLPVPFFIAAVKRVEKICNKFNKKGGS